MVGGTLVPPTATAFLMPYLSRLSTSALPSTTKIASESRTLGPAGRLSLPKWIISSTRTDCFISSVISSVSRMFSSNISTRIRLALSITYLLLEARTSSMRLMAILAMQGPTRSMVSRAAASMAVSTLSKLEGIEMVPLDFPPLDVICTSILPNLPVF
ncbi:MAG: hypothetical protein A4E43_01349 [Methanosaeta sp. PtaB.Bin005]|nr:MAG: hypothetical protein A4E43_01349 [Methanosaeta sp. PtaB.Bin005]